MNVTGISLTNSQDFAIPLAVGAALSFLAIKVGQCALKALTTPTADAPPTAEDPNKHLEAPATSDLPPSVADIPPQSANGLLPPPPAAAGAPTGSSFQEIDRDVRLPPSPMYHELRNLVEGLLSETGNSAGDTDNETLTQLKKLIKEDANPHEQENKDTLSAFSMLFKEIVKQHGHQQDPSKVDSQLIKALLILAESKTHQLTNRHYDTSTCQAGSYGFPDFLKALNTITYVNWMKNKATTGGDDDPFKDLFQFKHTFKTPFFFPYYEGIPLQTLAIDLGLKSEINRLIIDPIEEKYVGSDFRELSDKLSENISNEMSPFAHSPFGHKVPSNDSKIPKESARPARGSNSTPSKPQHVPFDFGALESMMAGANSSSASGKTSPPSGKLADGPRSKNKPKEEAPSVKSTSTPIASYSDLETCAPAGIAKEFTEISEKFKSIDDYLIYAVEKYNPESDEKNNSPILVALLHGFRTPALTNYMNAYYDELTWDTTKGTTATLIGKMFENSSY